MKGLFKRIVVCFILKTLIVFSGCSVHYFGSGSNNNNHGTVDSFSADLVKLESSSGTLSPVFDANVSSYILSEVARTLITITPTSQDPNVQSITVNGLNVASGAGAYVDMTLGSSLITIVVTAADAVITKTYTIAAISAPLYYYNAETSISNNGYRGCGNSNYDIVLGTTNPEYYFQLRDDDTGLAVYKQGSIAVHINSVGFLVDQYGYKMDPLSPLPTDFTKMLVAPNGTVLIDTTGSAAPLDFGTISAYSFDDPSVLTPIDGREGYYQTEVAPQEINVPGGFFSDSITYCGERVLIASNNGHKLISGIVKLHTRIEGGLLPAYFRLIQPDGNYAYTRDGTFMVDQDGEIDHVSSGLKLDGINSLPTGMMFSVSNLTSIKIAANGDVIIGDPAISLGSITLYCFEHPEELEQSREDPSLYRETSASGAASWSVIPGEDGTGTIVLDSIGIKQLRTPPAVESKLDAPYYYQIPAPATSYMACDESGNIQIQISSTLYYFELYDPFSGEAYYYYDYNVPLNLRLNEEGSMVDSNGYVLVSLPGLNLATTEKIKILPEGTVLVKTQGSDYVPFARIELYNFASSPAPVDGKQGYYQESASSGSGPSHNPDGSFFGISVLYCGERVLYDQDSSNKLLGEQARIHMNIDGYGLFQLMDSDGAADYTDSHDFIVDGEGYVREAFSGLLLEPRIYVPPYADLTTLSINEYGVATVNAGDPLIPTELGTITLRLFMGQANLKISQTNEGVYRASFTSDPNGIEQFPGAEGAGTINFTSLGINGVAP